MEDLSATSQMLAQSLQEGSQFECTGGAETDDEVNIDLSPTSQMLECIGGAETDDEVNMAHLHYIYYPSALMIRTPMSMGTPTNAHPHYTPSPSARLLQTPFPTGTSTNELVRGWPIHSRMERRHGEMFPYPPFEMASGNGMLDTSTEIDEDDEEDEEEMHYKTHCEKCKEAQQSPEYVKITPRKISKWRFQVQLEGEGTYECSATGLVFEVSEQALIRYSVLSWSKFSEFLGDSRRPAGSIYDVDVVNKDPSVLKFILFPHSLCISEPEHELSFSVLHVKEQHADIESTVDFTASHVKWRVSSLSPVGLTIPSSLQVKHHALVLIYKELNQCHKNIFIFQVYLASNNDSEIKAIEEQVLCSRKKFIKICKPATCRLKEKLYCLTSEPEGQIEPKNLEFITLVIALKGYFEARFGERPPFRLFLKDSDCDEPLWSATIREEDWNGEKKSIFNLFRMNRINIRPRVELQTIRASFGQRVSNPLMAGLLDDLYDQKRIEGQDLSDKQLLKVAETLGKEWEQVAIHLDLKNIDLDDIKAENIPVAMQKQKMLVLWKCRRSSGKATAQDLLRGLKELDVIPCDTHLLLREMMHSSE